MRERPASRLGAAAAAGLLTLPLLVVLVQAFADRWRAPALLPQDFGTRGLNVALSGQALDGLWNSLLVALSVTVVALLVGWPAARVLGERRLRRPLPVFLLLALPVLVPSYAVGEGLTEWFLRLGIADTLFGLVLGHLVLVVPYVIVVLLSGFSPQLTALEDMGRSAGLTGPARFRLITLPATRSTVIAAGLLGFLVSWSEYGISLAVGGGRPMLPLILLPFIQADPQVAAAVSLLFLFPAIAALLVAVRASRPSL